MKSIAIVTRGMMLGGIEKALISMLNNIDYTSYRVDLFIVESGGELEKEIPKEVKINYIYEKRLRDSIVESIKNFNITDLFNVTMIGINSRIMKNKYKLFRFMTKKLPNIDEVYDENMNKIGTARHPEEIIKLKLNTNINVVKYSMLRIKVGD